MNILKTVQQVLSEAGAPLHVKEITKRIFDQKLWQSEGKTPEATVAAKLYADIKKNGTDSAFEQTAPSTFKLRDGFIPSQVKPKAEVPQAKDTISFLEAAFRVLSQAGKPMKYTDITEKAFESGLLSSKGKTPEGTMYTQMLMDIRRYQNRGEQPRFVRHGKGMFGLTQWVEQGLADKITQHNKKVREELRKRLLDMEWKDFEELTARLLTEMGFSAKSTRGSKDRGIDVRGTLVIGDVIRIKLAVQVKKWETNNIQTDIVQKARGSLGTHEQGLIITTSDFSPKAREEAERPDAAPIGLMNGEQLVLLLVEYGIGVTRRSHDLIGLVESLGEAGGGGD